MSFQEKELDILRDAVDKNEKLRGKKKIDDPKIKKIIEIVEGFLVKKKRICYGGTAINNILPVEDQFYDRASELPDYDFFSPSPMKDAKELADLYYKSGFTEVVAQSGMHFGTFKVFVNFIPVADITELVPELYKNLQKDSLVRTGIHYSPPNFLRMLAYLELSRPLGDVSRWEKVLKRINLLNKNYPLRGLDCNKINVQRIYNADKSVDEFERFVFYKVRDSLIDQGVVFFGALASKLILKYLPEYHAEKIPNVPDFDVLSLNPETTAQVLKETLKDSDISKVKILKRKAVGEVIGEHYEVKVGNETVVFIFKPLGCLSYNQIKMQGKKIKIATIDTLLNQYLAFLYTNRPYFNDKRILCISEFMFKVQQRNRLKQKGLLRRFNIDCYGNQTTLEDIRSAKTDKYEELKHKRGTKEWEEYFLRYQPAKDKMNKTLKKKKRKKRKSQTYNILGKIES